MELLHLIPCGFRAKNRGRIPIGSFARMRLWLSASQTVSAQSPFNFGNESVLQRRYAAATTSMSAIFEADTIPVSRMSSKRLSSRPSHAMTKDGFEPGHFRGEDSTWSTESPRVVSCSPASQKISVSAWNPSSEAGGSAGDALATARLNSQCPQISFIEHLAVRDVQHRSSTA